jgi:chromobox protein 1
VVRFLDTKTARGRPAGTKGSNFKPPTGSWEEGVQRIDACKERDRTVAVYLIWKGGHKTKQTHSQVYKRCPQKVRHKTNAFLHVYRLIDSDVEIL